jgi:hypothetical protein
MPSAIQGVALMARVVQPYSVYVEKSREKEREEERERVASKHRM